MSNFEKIKENKHFFLAKIFYPFFLPSNFKFKIKELTVFLTNFCNLNCIYCSFFGKKGIWKNKSKKIMQYNDIKNIISFIPKGTKIFFTGGEPLLHPQIDKILKSTKRKRHFVILFTNGILLKKKAEKIYPYVDKFLISLDGPTPEINDLLRGPGSFKKTLLGIKKLSSFTSKKIEICFTINPQNILYLKDMILFIEDFLLPLNIKTLNFQHLFFITKKEKEKLRTLKYNLPEYLPKFNFKNLKATLILIFFQKLKVSFQTTKKFIHTIIKKEHLIQTHIKCVFHHGMKQLFILMVM
jgi:MoaA/NifB/PqqE/SkfB family radical SAM enzyme